MMQEKLTRRKKRRQKKGKFNVMNAKSQDISNMNVQH